MAYKPPTPLARPLAPHVQAANSRAVQARLQPPARPTAPHVEVALPVAQARAHPSGSRPTAPHVQAALAVGGRASLVQPQRLGPAPQASPQAPHVRKAVSAPPLAAALPIQPKKKDAQRYVGQHNLGFRVTHENVLAYVSDTNNPAMSRQELRVEWNRNQAAHFRIPDPAAPAAAVAAVVPVVALDPLAEALARLAAMSYLGLLPFPGMSPTTLERSPEWGDEKGHASGSLPGAFHVFRTGTEVELGFDENGWALDPDTGRKRSGPRRKALYNLLLGSAEHVLRGHFFDDVTLRSQARQNKPNFTWTSDRALLSAIERGRSTLSGQTAEVDISPQDGYGYVIEEDSGDLYKVHPKRATLVTKSGGDFKTAYGVTAIPGHGARVPLASFATMFHSWTKV
jgi:hypothetical protein